MDTLAGTVGAPAHRMHPDASWAGILPECRFEDRLAGKALALQDPEACITACDPAQLDDAFARIQAAQRQGRWIALLLDYELGEWLDPALAPERAATSGLANLVQTGNSDAPADASPTGRAPVSPAPQPRLTAWVFRRAVHDTPWTDTAAPGMSPSPQSPRQADLQVDRLQQGFAASASVSQPSQQSRHQPASLPPAQTAHHAGPQTLRLDSRPGIHPDTYRASIESLRDDMARGEFYQANYTFPIHVTAQGDLAQLYRRIANHHPSAHAVWFRDPRRTILSFSPELFVARQGSRLTVRPMKGTAPRDADPTQDQRNADTLQASQKDRAENLMIVDLLRNDLGRIATPGSVKVESLFSLERYPSVWTMTSTITAQAPQCNLRDILQALFPCGSITGAPKIAAMRRLRQIEPQPRGIYCGSIGWLAPDGDFSLNVAIRTLEFPDPAASWESATYTPDTAATQPIHLGRFGVGGGIVHDSRPDMEWQECLWKARLLTLPGMGAGHGSRQAEAHHANPCGDHDDRNAHAASKANAEPDTAGRDHIDAGPGAHHGTPSS